MQQAIGKDPLIGAKVGNYEVRQKLGEGGMGSVYLAEHPLIGKKVALKVLHSEFASNQDVVSRFFTEAKAVNDIQHPNIVDIIDYGTLRQADGSTMVYFIMEFLGGTSLSQLIRREAPLSPERALRICVQIADALGASHRANIVHRDLKPDNVILIDRRHEADFVKVLDFGIAKLTGDQPGSRRTRTGIVMGTPSYMSPEQCEGRGEVDHRTDIYALGILLYEMLTAKVPFEGEGYGEVLVQHLTQPPVRPSTIRGVIPPHVESVCLRALEKHSGDRYPSMDEFVRALTDPISYVEAAGGTANFTTSNLGAPQLTPYPAAAMAPLTPLPGQLAPVPTPAPIHGQHSWPSPAYGVGTASGAPTGSRLPAIIAGALVAVGLTVGALLMFGGSDEKAAAVDAGMTREEAPDAARAALTVPMDAAPIAIDAPAAPQFVLINIKSRPKGAEIFRIGEKRPIGKTPFKWKIGKTDKTIGMVLTRKGYTDVPFTADLRFNETVDLSMKKDKETKGGKGGKSGKGDGSGSGSGSSGDPDNTMNPFGNN